MSTSKEVIKRIEEARKALNTASSKLMDAQDAMAKMTEGAGSRYYDNVHSALDSQVFNVEHTSVKCDNIIRQLRRF